MKTGGTKTSGMNPERVFTVLQRPHFTEKATRVTEKHNQYVFLVSTDATKPEIKTAVEQLFKVRVEAVTTSNMRGKVKKTNYGQSVKNDRKKAYVRLAAGNSIDFASFE
jgi:large subunit ribosomal protein L23